jgi:zinc D-Ala-D-Ala carboxypeptidase
MLDMITPNFSRAEMQCKCGCGLSHMDDEFMRMLQLLRDKLGPLPITSGARCEEHNKREGGYPKSAHLQSKAADIRIYGPRALALVEEARRIGFSGVGISQKGDHAKRFIHLDTLSRAAIWSY